VYTSTDCLARERGEREAIAWQARRLNYGGGVRGAGRLPVNPQLLRPARKVIGRHIYFAVGRASAYIRLSLRINILLIIGRNLQNGRGFFDSVSLIRFTCL